MTNYTNDPLSACCGDPGDCSRAHLYCFNRQPKEADVAAMNTFEATFAKTSQAAQDAINGATHGSTINGEEATAALTQLASQQEPREMILASESAARKATPMCAGVLDYFPLALAAVARLSKIGNDKHNPGQPLHWSRDKSTDHADCIVRHLIDRGTVDPDSGELHDVGLAWRALANLQLAEEKRLAKG